MRKILGLLIVIVVFALIPNFVNAKSTEINLKKNYGGTDNDAFYSVVATADGGCVAVGQSSSTDIVGLTSNGSSDAIIVKYDKDMTVQWQKNYGGTNADAFRAVIVTEDGGYVAVGESSSAEIIGFNYGIIYPTNAIIVKYDKDGTILWQHYYGGGSIDSFNSVTQITDGSYVAAGKSSSTDIAGLTSKGDYDAIIVKYDKDGVMISQNNYGGSSDDKFASTMATEDGGYIVVGNSSSIDIGSIINNGWHDAIIIKYDKNNIIQWQKNYGDSKTDDFSSVITTKGGYVVVGYTESNQEDRNAVIIKYAEDGTVQWQKNYGGNSGDYFDSVIQTINGEYVACGRSYSTNIQNLTHKGELDAIIVRYDKNGIMNWQQNYGGNKYDYFYSVAATKNDDYIAVGSSYSTDINGLTIIGGRDAIISSYSTIYDITINSANNGTITADKTTAKFNDIVTLTVAPNTQYKLKNITGITTTKVNETTYTFIMPNSNITIGAEFEQIYEENVNTETSEEVPPSIIDNEIVAKKDETPKTGVNYFTGIITISTVLLIGIFTLSLKAGRKMWEKKLTCQKEITNEK